MVINQLAPTLVSLLLLVSGNHLVHFVSSDMQATAADADHWGLTETSSLVEVGGVAHSRSFSH